MRGDRDLNISDETYCELFWQFVHDEEAAYSTVSAMKRPKGPVIKHSDYPDRLNQMQTARQCDLCYQNHRTSMCPEHIKTGREISSNILEELSQANVCARCL